MRKLSRCAQCLFAGTLTLLATQACLAGINEWSGGGFEGGRVYDVISDPSTPGKFFAATVNGPFVTTDGGATWVRRADGANATIADLALADDDVLFALDDGVDAQLFRSPDAGISWVQLASLPAGFPRSIAVAPSNSSRLTLITSEAGSLKLYLSTDSGATFILSETGLPAVNKNQVAFHPTNDQIVYCATDVGVYWSTDGGTTWAPRNTGGVSLARSVAVSRSNPMVLLACDLGSVAYSSDGGATWTVNIDVEPGTGPQVWIAPSDPNSMAAMGTVFVSFSTDGGVTWQPGVEPASPFRVWALAFDAADDGKVLVGASTLGISKSADGGATWSISSAGMNASYAWNWSAPSSATRAYDAQALFRTDDGAATWQAIYGGLLQSTSLLFTEIAVDAADSDHVLAVNVASGYMFETTDAGSGWQDVTPQPFPLFNYFSAVAIDPLDPQRWAIGNETFVIVGEPVDPVLALSHDGGASWQTGLVFEETNEFDSHTVNSIRFSPDDPNVLLVGGYSYFQDSGYSCWVQRSADEGATWTQTILSSGFCYPHLSVDPSDPQKVYLLMFRSSGASELFKSTDNGQTWTPLPGAPTPLGLAVNPVNGEVYLGSASIYGSSDPLYRSTDGGASWQPFTRRGLSDEVRFAGWVDVSATDPPAIWISTNAGTFAYTGFVEIFADGFESGDTTAWSVAVP